MRSGQVGIGGGGPPRPIGIGIAIGMPRPIGIPRPIGGGGPPLPMPPIGNIPGGGPIPCGNPPQPPGGGGPPGIGRGPPPCPSSTCSSLISLPDSDREPEPDPEPLLLEVPLGVDLRVELPYEELLGILMRPQHAQATRRRTIAPTTPPMIPPSDSWLIPLELGAGATYAVAVVGGDVSVGVPAPRVTVNSCVVPGLLIVWTIT